MTEPSADERSKLLDELAAKAEAEAAAFTRTAEDIERRIARERALFEKGRAELIESGFIRPVKS